MAKIHTIKVPTKEGIKEVQGKRVKLYVGNYQHDFLLQEHFNATLLTHYDSGMKIMDLSAAKFQMVMAGLSRYKGNIQDRDAAKFAIETLVAKHGADEFNRRLDSAPKIN